jgi:hypothetical protein
LVQAGVVTPEEVEDAARAQVAYGGRIGTNLVELDHLEIDELAVFLGRQHRLPPAQREHFEQADPELQRQLPAEVAARYGVVPLARIPGIGAHRRIAIASTDPLAPEALAAVATALSCEQADLVIAVAAELRMLYNLEKVYGIARPSRYLRTRRGGTSELAIVPLPESDSGEDDLAVPEAVPEAAEDEVTRPIAEDDVVLELAPEEPSAAEAPERGAERRRFVRTVADEPEATHPAEPVVASLGRIQIRKLAIAAANEDARAAADASVTGALRAIRRCRDREGIGALAIEVLDRGAGDAADAGVLFIARGPVAVAWRGFSRDAEVDFDQVAVPLDQPSAIAREPGVAIRRIDADHPPTPLDERVIAALGFAQPTFAVAVPIAIRDHLIGFVYAHGRGDGAEVERIAVEVADATRAALVSLLRAAQR